jgi:hypothetical protein
VAIADWFTDPSDNGRSHDVVDNHKRVAEAVRDSALSVANAPNARGESPRGENPRGENPWRAVVRHPVSGGPMGFLGVLARRVVVSPPVASEQVTQRSAPDLGRWVSVDLLFADKTM